MSWFQEDHAPPVRRASPPPPPVPPPRHGLLKTLVFFAIAIAVVHAWETRKGEPRS
jgi:hypothetical protein